MKRTVFFLMLALLCATSHAQINPKMQQLFDKLTEMGEAPRIIKHGGKDQPTVLEYGMHLYYSPNMYRDSHTPFIDSLLREDKNNLEQGLAAIRHTLDDLQAEAAESYHYEYHKGGRDTIVYSMNLCRDTVLNTSKHRSGSHPLFYSNEYLYFNYQPYHKEGEVGANLQYTVNIPSPGPQAEKNSFESLVADIVKLFNQNKIKPRTAMWQHDKAYSDSILAAEIPPLSPWFALADTAMRAKLTHRYSPCHANRRRKPGASTTKYQGWLSDSQKATLMSCTATTICLLKIPFGEQ